MGSSGGRLNATTGFGLLVLFVFSTRVLASDSSSSTAISMPDCALACLVAAISNSTCAATDLSCGCADGALNRRAGACTLKNCTVKEALTAENMRSNFCNVPVDTDDEVVPVLAVFMSLSTLAVTLRLMARYLTGCRFWWDDLCNCLAMLGTIIFTGLNFKAIDLGMGKDIWYVPFSNITEILVIFFTNFLLYALSRGFIRASICFFYLRVFPSISELRLSRIVVITMCVSVLHSLAFMLAIILQCKPVETFWLQWDGEHEGYCGNFNTLGWIAATTGIAFDTWLIALPFPRLLELKLHWKKKFIAGAMFAVGVCVILVSIIRLKTINEFTRTINPTKDFVQVGLWSGIELHVGLMCPCLPSIRLLLVKLIPRLGGSTAHDTFEPSLNMNRCANPAHITERSSATTPPANIETHNNKSWESDVRLVEFGR